MHNLTHFLRSALIVCLTLAFSVAARAQDRCGFVEVMQNIHARKVLRESDQQFENWMTLRREESSARDNASERYRIPVVVHVIHRGEAVGSGGNISDAQIISQINVLNKDFSRQNTDASSTPTEFQSVAGGMNIEFVLARQTPDGQPTNGIVRVKGSKTSWSATDDSALKAVSYWPAEDYLNIWVTNLSGTLLGYAQFPVSSTLTGLEDADDNRLTDGVVIDYTVFGSADDGSFTLDSQYNKGRTATHEVGHYLGLRHIWGDDSGACGGNGDYVSDTPDQGNSTAGCPAHPQTTCTVHKMFQNYMDYTNDACMNLFTEQQVGRMVTVMDNSPRRVTLPASKGLIDPVPFTRNLELTSVTSPAAMACAGQVTPQAVVTNNSYTAIADAQIELIINGTTVETRTFTFTTPVATLASTTVSFSPITLNPGNTTVAFQILTVNGSADEQAADDTQVLAVEVPGVVTAPFTEAFDSWPATWKIVNPDAAVTWAWASAPDASTSNMAAFMNFYNYPGTESATDMLLSPVFSLATATTPYLTFDVSYAVLQNFSDGLQVYVLTQCGTDITGLTPVYSKSGAELATVSASSAAFVPSSPGQWRHEIVDLRAYIGQPNVRLAFYSVNGSGNNLYVDNIGVVTSITENVAIAAVTEPAAVRCESRATPVVTLRNNSAVAVTSLTIRYTADGTNNLDTSFSNIEGFGAGQEKSFTLPEITLQQGANTLTFEAVNPNGYEDIGPADNSKTLNVVVSTVADVLPLRENFNDVTYQSRWTTVNPQGGISWNATSTNYGGSLYVNAASGTTMGDEAWLVSPTLDLSGTTAASMFFDLSYWYTTQGGGRDVRGTLRIVASTDCGVTYDRVLFDKAGDALSISAAAKTGSPASADFWNRIYISLDELVGSSGVRIAFVFTNDKGSDIYLDNIEFYLSDDPTPKSTADRFVVYGTDLASAADFYVTFNLQERQPVSYQLVDVMGKQVMNEDLTEVLNQTYRVAPTGVSAGVYILRLHIGSEFYSTRVYVGRH
jgi:hypothetical protein